MDLKAVNVLTVNVNIQPVGKTTNEMSIVVDNNYRQHGKGIAKAVLPGGLLYGN